MITIATPDKITRTRTGVAVGVIALACTGLVGCSSGGGSTAAKPPTGHTAGTSSSSGPSALPNSSTPASSAAAAPSSVTRGIGTDHACALLTRADVAAAIGEPVGAGTEQAKAGAGAACFYSSSGTTAGGLISVANWQKATDVFRAHRIKLRPLGGIGDQAFSTFGGGGSPAILVRRGSVGFEISIHGSKVLALADHGLAKEEDLARLVLSRL